MILYIPREQACSRNLNRLGAGYTATASHSQCCENCKAAIFQQMRSTVGSISATRGKELKMPTGINPRRFWPSSFEHALFVSHFPRHNTQPLASAADSQESFYHALTVLRGTKIEKKKSGVNISYRHLTN